MNKTKAKLPLSRQSFSQFLQDPVIATALLVFAFIALMFSLMQFTDARGPFGG